MTDPKPPEPHRFEPGDVVRHKRYGYRGVVFRRDAVCEATETRYQGRFDR